MVSTAASITASIAVSIAASIAESTAAPATLSPGKATSRSPVGAAVTRGCLGTDGLGEHVCTRV